MRRWALLIAEASLEGAEVSDRAVSLIFVVIFKFRNPDDIDDRTQHGDYRNNPPCEGGNCGGAGMDPSVERNCFEHSRSLALSPNLGAESGNVSCGFDCSHTIEDYLFRELQI